MKTITVKQIGYQIVGLAAISLWGGNEGTIPMTPTKLTQEKYPTEQQIRESINDGGFGAMNMEGAVVRVDTLYEHGAKTYGEARFFNLGGRSNRHVVEILELGHPNSSVDLYELEPEYIEELIS